MNFLAKIFFFPFSLLWSFLYSLRRYMYLTGILKSDFFLIPVISVGNIVMGGSGKTPFVAWLLDVFQQSGKNVCILSRGYRSKLENSFGVIQENSPNKDPALFGDEPVLLSNRLKGNSLVVVGKKRSLNLKKIFKKFTPDIVLLDDGFQHLKMRRDINIVLFDGTISLDKLHTPPLGYLRESLNSLREADIVVLNKVGMMAEDEVSKISKVISEYLRDDVQIFKTSYKVSGVCNIKGELIEEIQNIKGKDVLSFSGIANPDNFNHTLLSLGANIEHTFNFSDHFNYKQEDIDKILNIAQEKNLEIFTTEKDIVKLVNLSGIEKVKYLSIEVSFLEEKEKFLNLINDKMVFNYYNNEKLKMKLEDVK